MRKFFLFAACAAACIARAQFTTNPPGVSGTTFHYTTNAPGVGGGTNDVGGPVPAYVTTLNGRVTDTNFFQNNSAAMFLTNLALQSSWFANQQDAICRTPPLGIASWYGAFDGTSWTNENGGAVLGISNAIVNLKQFLYPAGYRYLVLDDGWGTTNLDANNLMQLSPKIGGTFGTVSNFIYAVHTNGLKVCLYLDGGTNLSSGRYQHGMGDYLLWTNVAALGRYGVDGLKSDQFLLDKERIAAIIAANGYPIFFTGSVQLNGTDGPLPFTMQAFMNGWRLVSGGDITSYAQLIRWCDVAMTNNWWAWVRPGHFIDMDYIGGAYGGGGGYPGTKTHFVICALFSAPIYDDSSFSFNGPMNPIATNAALLAINQDPAVICAQRYIQTNGCDVYLKPLGSPNGPQFALGVVNRSTTATTNVTLWFTNLPPLFSANAAGWSAFDCISNAGWVLNGAQSFTVTLGPADSILWKLTPGFAISTNVIAANFPDSEVFSVVSNGVPMTIYSSWDLDVSNYVARAGLTNQTEILAAANAVALGKTHGWWNKLDCLYLFRGSSSNSTAQNLISSSYPVKWSASGVTFSWNGVTGDGVTGYGDTQFNPSTATNPHYTQTSASILFYNQTASPTVNLGAFMGVKNGVWSGAVWTTSTATMTALGMNYANWGSAANVAGDITGTAAGPWCIDRNEATPWIFNGNSYLGAMYHSTQARASDTAASVGIPTGNFYLFCNDFGGPANYQACTLSAVAIGSGFTEPQYFAFLADLNTVENMLRLRIP